MQANWAELKAITIAKEINQQEELPVQQNKEALNEAVQNLSVNIKCSFS